MLAITLLALPSIRTARAEPGAWSLGPRLGVATQAGALVGGGQVRWRASHRISVELVAGGGWLGPTSAQHDLLDRELRRDLFELEADVACHVLSTRTLDVRVLAGVGTANERTLELDHALPGMDDWIDHGDRWRPLATLGLALEHGFDVAGTPTAIGLEIRGLYLGENGPTSDAPELARLGAQAVLAMNAQL